MSFEYNGAETDISSMPQISELSDDLNLSGAKVTYLTSYHVGRKDFDPSWKPLISDADVVLHEGFAWPWQAKIALTNIVKGGVRAIRGYGAQKDSFSWQRLEAVIGSKAKQDFWDASSSQATEYGLRDKMQDYHAAFVEAEELLKQGELNAALATMQKAKTFLGSYDEIRDRIGINSVVTHAQEIDKPDSSIVVLAGGAHLYQATTLAQLQADQDATVQTKSLIDDPFNLGLVEYGNFLSGTANDEDTTKAWLANLLNQEVRSRQSFRSASSVVNQVNGEVKAMSLDQATGQLATLGRG